MGFRSISLTAPETPVPAPPETVDWSGKDPETISENGIYYCNTGLPANITTAFVTAYVNPSNILTQGARNVLLLCYQQIATAAPALYYKGRVGTNWGVWNQPVPAP